MGARTMKTFSLTIRCDTAEELAAVLESAAEETRCNSDAISDLEVDDEIQFDSAELSRIE